MHYYITFPFVLIYKSVFILKRINSLLLLYYLVRYKGLFLPILSPPNLHYYVDIESWHLFVFMCMKLKWILANLLWCLCVTVSQTTALKFNLPFFLCPKFKVWLNYSCDNPNGCEDQYQQFTRRQNQMMVRTFQYNYILNEWIIYRNKACIKKWFWK